MSAVLKIVTPERRAMPKRRTDYTAEQRAALDEARRLLMPHFAGEQVRLYVPQQPRDERLERVERITQALRAGSTAVEVSRTFDVSLRWVRKLRGTLPP